MDPPKIGLGAALLAASGVTMQVTGLPGARLPIVLAGAAALVLAASLLGLADEGPTP